MGDISTVYFSFYDTPLWTYGPDRDKDREREMDRRTDGSDT